MDAESQLDTRCALNPEVSFSIRSADSVTVFGIGVPLELPLSLLQVLMSFADEASAREVYKTLEVDVDLERFGNIIHEFCAHGLLIPAEVADQRLDLGEALGRRLFDGSGSASEVSTAMRAGRPIVIPDALPVELAERAYDELDHSDKWVVDEGGHDFFQYRNSVVSQLAKSGGALAECNRLFRVAAARAPSGSAAWCAAS